MCIQEIIKLIDSNELVCICYGNDYKNYFVVSCTMLKMVLYTCVKLSVMPVGADKGKMCLHTDMNAYEHMRSYFGF